MENVAGLLKFGLHWNVGPLSVALHFPHRELLVIHFHVCVRVEQVVARWDIARSSQQSGLHVGGVSLLVEPFLQSHLSLTRLPNRVQSSA